MPAAIRYTSAVKQVESAAMTASSNRAQVFAGLSALALAAFAGSAVAHTPACAVPQADHLPRVFTQAILKNEPFPGARFAMIDDVTRRLQQSDACFDPNMTPEQIAWVVQNLGGGPVGARVFNEEGGNGGVGPNFFTNTSVYRGGGPGTPWTLTNSIHGANRIRLTYSFPADGTTWGTSADFGTGPNDLNARITGSFGATRLDLGREYIRHALAAWRRSAAITYDEVADNNTAMNTSSFAQYGPGDIRIGGYTYGLVGVLAYNNFPGSGSDMAINTSYWSSYANSGNLYRFLRNTLGHEHGHGLAAIHPVPCNNTKLMEPIISTNFDTLATDDIRFAQRNYGDRYAGNTGPSFAQNFGDLTLPTVRSVREIDLSTNGRTTFNGAGTASNLTGVDWFRFTLSSPQTVTITVDPKGGTYLNDRQNTAPGSATCDGVNGGSPPTVVADEAGDLTFNLYQSDGTTLVASSVGGGVGVTETLSANLPAGTYTIRVWDSIASNPAANQVVQLYDFIVRVGTSFAPPQAVAGLNKRCPANTLCYFLGNVTTRVTEPGATISSTGYAWDIDGDSVNDLTVAQTAFTYVSNGDYPVTLRVTDSNGAVDTDTINVTVFGATTSVTANSPSSGEQGQTIPITLTGTNFKTLTSASQVTVSGTGVTVTGTPVSNPRGTSLTGLSLVIAPGAALGNRTITVTNGSAVGTGGSFNVLLGVPCPTISQPPVDTIAYQGRPFTLSATAAPAGVTYQWRKDTNPINLATGPTYTVPAADFADAGSYDVVVTNACGNVTSTAAIVSVYCLQDYNADQVINLEDLSDFVTDFYAVPTIPGGLQPSALTFPDRPVGYGIPCPAAADASSPFAVDAHRSFGYRVGFSSDGSNDCPVDAFSPFPNLDNLSDYVTAYYNASFGACP
jgi:serralysin